MCNTSESYGLMMSLSRETFECMDVIQAHVTVEYNGKMLMSQSDVITLDNTCPYGCTHNFQLALLMNFYGCTHNFLRLYS